MGGNLVFIFKRYFIKKKILSSYIVNFILLRKSIREFYEAYSI